jgi:hypothetical protein
MKSERPVSKEGKGAVKNPRLPAPFPSWNTVKTALVVERNYIESYY